MKSQQNLSPKIAPRTTETPKGLRDLRARAILGHASPEVIVKLALSQTVPTDGDVAAAFDHATRMAGAAGLAGADLLVLPELFLPGYNRPDLHETLAQSLEGAWVQQMGAIARAAGVWIVFGWAERAGAQIYNAVSALDRDGVLRAHYRKIQLYGAMERGVFTPGTAPPPVFDCGPRKIGLLVCYDIEFPQHAGGLARAGADMILVPTANPQGFPHVPEVLVPARAHENALSIAYANYCGTEAGLQFGGGSVIAGPDARVIAQAGAGPALLIADVPARDSYPASAISTQAADLRQL